MKTLETMCLLLILPCLSKRFTSDASAVWLQTPGTLYVCEGLTAEFRWIYNTSIETFEGLVFSKRSPIERTLVEKHVGQEANIRDESINFTLHPGKRTEAYFMLTNVSYRDSGQYEIDVFLDGHTPYIYNKANLSVIAKTDCPDPYLFKHPDMFLQISLDYPVGEIRLKQNNTLTITKPVMVTIGLTVPIADPPIRCSITKGPISYQCMRTPHTTATCMAEIFLDGITDHIILVKLDFIAYESSISEIHVKVVEANDLSNSTGDRNSNQVGSHKGHEQSVNRIMVASFTTVLVLLIAACICILICLRAKGQAAWVNNRIQFPDARQPLNSGFDNWRESDNHRGRKEVNTTVDTYPPLGLTP